MVRLVVLVVVLGVGEVAVGEVVGRSVEYTVGGTTFEGYLAYEDGAKGKRPGVLVVHDWLGVDDWAKEQARGLAEMGYVAFAADMYGKGVRPANQKEAAAEAGKVKGDRKLMRARVNGALETLRKQEQVDPEKLAAIGFCFGGTTVLELARSGADVDAVVSFHGGLDTPSPAEAKGVKAYVLVLHGADDPHVPAKQVEGFVEEMKAAEARWQLNMYGNAVHSFTRPDAGNDPSKGAAYNEAVAKRAWGAMKLLFEEVLK